MPRPEAPLSLLPLLIASSGLLTVAVLVGLNGIPGRDLEARSAWNGRDAHPWRLRSTDHGAVPSPDPSAPRLRLAAENPDERRIVRVVYPGLTGPR